MANLKSFLNIFGLGGKENEVPPSYPTSATTQGGQGNTFQNYSGIYQLPIGQGVYNGTLQNTLNHSSQNILNQQINKYNQMMKESEERIKKLEERIRQFDPFVKNFLNDIKPHLMFNNYNLYTPTFSSFNGKEAELNVMIQVGNLLSESLKKRDFANKLEGIIND